MNATSKNRHRTAKFAHTHHQGAVHGPLTRFKGETADQVLELDVIIVDARRQIIWLDGTSTEGQQKLAKNVTKQVEILQTMAECPQSDAYINEVDPNEANWQQKFFGPIENYNRLKSVKDIVSLNGLFACKKCVSGDD
ncbi:unnamed protein product [Rotaria sordida]|uniref:Berberine/berberine-like domain-containing protein n=1 Tax=Rotaria sordida TaxID=392033 RepID=A0A813QC40_9BILA|nr:unnamed protein product [Rotaria sordida]CAF0768665.1 unnamed protein product [Rotaria sordida]